ncbi:hypothetical protein G4X40_19750 [Rhodococcus sp. D2-41]|uniref:Head-to-tail stopper n=1 Tax=Speluncibacter jeojiensis TaxID=2710754 RepID=A0A9X4RC78_9ACTN|nr:hypothetical protein [Rhodococcus sp. D2-41]MDG3012378.1 hypothetical protein [Rhodococcus sp. D2-41]MDG3013550.1 hypothetical protein [Corynebacteriales bacterium D3-21]
MILGNDTVTVIKRAPTGAMNSVGQPAMTETPTVVPGCSFQPTRTAETVSDVDLTVSYWTLYAPAVPAITQLEATDAIEVNGVVFEDFGDPQPWTGLNGNPSHVTLTVRKARG